MDIERQELLANIASMYFEESLTQTGIAQRTGYSRSMVSRLLADARKQGIVEIVIHHPLARRPDLEDALRSAFDLKEVQVLARGTLGHETMLQRLGELGARWVEGFVQEQMSVGISWGTGLSALVKALSPQKQTDIKVAQVIGALGTSDPTIDGFELARQLARKFGGQYEILPAPLIVESESIQQGLAQSFRVRQVLGRAARMDLVLAGVGTLDPERSSLVRSGFLAPEQLDELVAAGAIGDVCVIHFNINGEIINTPLTRRVVGIQYETLKRIPVRLGVSGGREKALPILGALRAQMINVLITDDVAATGILTFLDSPEKS